MLCRGIPADLRSREGHVPDIGIHAAAAKLAPCAIGRISADNRVGYRKHRAFSISVLVDAAAVFRRRAVGDRRVGRYSFLACPFRVRFDLYGLGNGVDAAAVAAGDVGVHRAALDGQIHQIPVIFNIEVDTAAIAGRRIPGNLRGCSRQRAHTRIDAAARAAVGPVAVDADIADLQLGAVHIPALIDAAAVGLCCVVGNGGTNGLAAAAVCPGLAGTDGDRLGQGIDAAAAAAGGVSVDGAALDRQHLVIAVCITIRVKPHTAAIACCRVVGNGRIRNIQVGAFVGIQSAAHSLCGIVRDVGTGYGDGSCLRLHSAAAAFYIGGGG